MESHQCCTTHKQPIEYVLVSKTNQCRYACKQCLSGIRSDETIHQVADIEDKLSKCEAIIKDVLESKLASVGPVLYSKINDLCEILTEVSANNLKPIPEPQEELNQIRANFYKDPTSYSKVAELYSKLLALEQSHQAFNLQLYHLISDLTQRFERLATSVERMKEKSRENDQKQPSIMVKFDCQHLSQLTEQHMEELRLPAPLICRLEQVREEAVHLNQKRREEEFRNAVLSRQLDISKEKNTSMKLEFTRVEEIFAKELSEKTVELESSRQQLKQTIGSLHKLQLKNTALETQVKEHERQLHIANRGLQRLAEAKQRALMQNEQLQQQIRSLRRELVYMQQKLMQKAGEYSSLEKDCSALEKSIAQSKKQHNECQQKLKSQKQRRQFIQQQAKYLELQVWEMREEEQIEKKKAEEVINAKSKQLEELTTKLTTLRSTNAKLEGKAKELEERKANMDQQAKNLIETITNLQNSQKSMESSLQVKDKSLESLKGTVQQLQAENQKKQERIQEIQTILEKEEKKARSREQQVEAANTYIQKLLERGAELQKQNKALQQQLFKTGHKKPSGKNDK